MVFSVSSGFLHQKTDHHDITEILLKVSLDTIKKYNASSLKQLSVGRHVLPHGHIILILSQTVFDFTPECYMISGEASTTNCIVFVFNLPGVKPTICHTQDKQAFYFAIAKKLENVDIP